MAYIGKSPAVGNFIKLDEIFRFRSSFVREINFYDFNNDVPITLHKSEPLTPSLPELPNIIKLLFGNNTTVLTYLDKYNMDFLAVERGLKSCLTNSPDDYNKIKYLIYNKDNLKIGMDVSFTSKGKGYKGTIKTIGDGHVLIDIVNRPKPVKVPLSKLEYEQSPTINVQDLELLVKNEIFKSANIGFLLITNINNTNQLKHTLELIYQDPNPNTKFILLYHLYNKDTKGYNLTNIMIRNIQNFLTLGQLYKNDRIKKIIDTDYSDIKIS